MASEKRTVRRTFSNQYDGPKTVPSAQVPVTVEMMGILDGFARTSESASVSAWRIGSMRAL